MIVMKITLTAALSLLSCCLLLVAFLQAKKTRLTARFLWLILVIN
jgi:hypothetical protein